MTLQVIQDYGRLIEDFCEDCMLRDMSEESIRRYRSSLKTFTQHLSTEGIGIDHVDREVLKGYLGYLRYEAKVKHKTIENNFSAISSFYDYLALEEIVNSNIIPTFRKRYLRRYKVNYEDPERKLLSVEEMSKLVNSIMDPRDKAIAVLLAKTGIRRGEMLKIDVDDIKRAR